MSFFLVLLNIHNTATFSLLLHTFQEGVQDLHRGLETFLLQQILVSKPGQPLNQWGRLQLMPTKAIHFENAVQST